MNANFKNYWIINGDANCRNEIWDNQNDFNSDEKSENIVEWSNINNYNIINNGLPTHQNYTTKKENAIDITMVSNDTNKLITQWYISQDSRSNEYKIDNKFLSDHYFLVTWINFEAYKFINKKYTSFNFESGDHEIYNVVLCQLLSLWFEYFHKYKYQINKLNEITLYLQDIIKYAGSRSYGIVNYDKSKQRWMNKRFDEIRKEKKKLRRKYHRLRNKQSERGQNIRIMIKSYDNEMKQMKLNAIKKYQIKLEKKIQKLCEKDDKLFYQLSKQAMNEPNQRICPLKDDNGKIIATTAQQQADLLHNHFNKKVKENEYQDEHKEWHQYIENTVNNEFINDESNNDEWKENCKILNKNITKQEIINSIESSKLNTACGYDNIHIKLIYHGRFTLALALQYLFNLIFTTYYIFPLCWCLININPIPKPDRDNSLLKNNRPISLPMAA